MRDNLCKAVQTPLFSSTNNTPAQMPASAPVAGKEVPAGHDCILCSSSAQKVHFIIAESVQFDNHTHTPNPALPSMQTEDSRTSALFDYLPQPSCNAPHLCI